MPYRPCVGMCVLNAQKNVFVARRAHIVEAAWQMPQGGIEAGEDPLSAAWRELEEETGAHSENTRLIDQISGWLSYDLPPKIAKKCWSGQYRGQKQRWFLFQYHGADDDIKLCSKEFSDWMWVSPQEACNLIVPFKKEIYQAVFQHFQAHF